MSFAVTYSVSKLNEVNGKNISISLNSINNLFMRWISDSENKMCMFDREIVECSFINAAYTLNGNDSIR